jgi:hypothetical protein
MLKCQYSFYAIRTVFGLCKPSTGIRGVSSLGPLGSAFNSRTNIGRLPWNRPATGLFGVEELKTGEGFYTIKDRCLHNSLKLVEEACSPNRLVLRFFATIRFFFFLQKFDFCSGTSTS